MKKMILFLSVFIIFTSLSNAQQNNPKFSGLMFGDYFYNAANHDSSQKDLNGFQFRRIYITTDYTISDNFSSRFRLEADQGEITNNGKITTMVKDAWLKWKDIFNGSDFIFGISPTPAFEVSEAAWGHRYLEKTILDLSGTVSSRDLGVDLKGKLNGEGSLKYWVKIGNNSGNAPEVNKYKRFYGLLEFDLTQNFLVTLYGDYASNPKKLDPYNNQMKDNSAFVFAGFVNYKQTGLFGLGAEGFMKSQQNQVSNSGLTSLTSQNGFGVSLWAYINFTETIQLVGRFDTLDPNTDKEDDGRNLILAGLQFNPIKNVSITPNIEVFTYQQKGIDNDVTPRITFKWEF